jgi:hypothetical protein
MVPDNLERMLQPAGIVDINVCYPVGANGESHPKTPMVILVADGLADCGRFCVGQCWFLLPTGNKCLDINAGQCVVPSDSVPGHHSSFPHSLPMVHHQVSVGPFDYPKGMESPHKQGRLVCGTQSRVELDCTGPPVQAAIISLRL